VYTLCADLVGSHRARCSPIFNFLFYSSRPTNPIIVRVLCGIEYRGKVFVKETNGGQATAQLLNAPDMHGVTVLIALVYTAMTSTSIRPTAFWGVAAAPLCGPALPLVPPPLFRSLPATPSSQWFARHAAGYCVPIRADRRAFCFGDSVVVLLCFGVVLFLLLCCCGVVVVCPIRGIRHAYKGKFVKELLGRCDADLTIADAQNRTVLHYLAVCGHLSQIEFLFSRLKKKGARAMLAQRCSAGWSALHYAAHHGHKQV
jgi:hypothetical protein